MFVLFVKHSVKLVNSLIESIFAAYRKTLTHLIHARNSTMDGISRIYPLKAISVMESAPVIWEPIAIISEISDKYNYKRISPKFGTLADIKKIEDDVQTDATKISNKKIKNFVIVRWNPIKK